jgi:hypothetical protein
MSVCLFTGGLERVMRAMVAGNSATKLGDREFTSDLVVRRDWYLRKT